MRTKDWLTFIALSLAWGSSFLWIKIVLEEIGPFLLVALRLSIGVAAMLAYYFYKRPEMPKLSSTWRTLFVVGMLNTAIPFVLISWGEVFIDSAMAAILNGSVPLFTIVIAHLYLNDDRLTSGRVIGLLTGFAGVVILVARDYSSGGQSSLIGQGAVLLAALLYAISAVYVRRTTEDISPIVRALIPLAAADGVIWLATPLVEAPLQLPQMTITWVALAWLGLIGSFLAYLLYYSLIHAVGPTRATMVTYTFPLVGVVLGVVFLHEVLDWSLALGGALVLGSLAIVNRSG
ncbi:MAG: DMT family transporter [Chloroflexi bacterium]|nr:DMT family transporter [Chloroflexota bacterium]